MKKLSAVLMMLALLFTVRVSAQDTYVRQAVIPVPDTTEGFGSGFGNIVAGVDFDGDGQVEIYAVNDEWNDTPGEEVPTIYKYEFDGTNWTVVWSAKLDFSGQNTWPALEKADLDNDGKPEIVWGPVNALSDANPNPPRFVVFEYSGSGDAMGVDDGSGNYKPNAVWNANVADKEEMRPIKWVIGDFDDDGRQEIAWASRKGNITFGICSVDNIPDNGDGSETWTMEFAGNDPKTQFIRQSRLPSPDGGFGNVVAGVDYDGDGLMDVYAVNNDWSDGPNGELIPTLYKYELVNDALVLRWSTVLPGVTLQNTWPVLLAGDWDGDGKGEIIWCPVNNLGDGNANPPRIVVYETPGDGSDIMGIDNGDGTYRPNAQWNMNLPDNTEMRPFNGALADVTGDGKLDFIFTERKAQWGWGVVDVSDIPDNGDGSETWTLVDHGAEGNYMGYSDFTIIGGKIAMYGSKANLTFLQYNAATAKFDTVATQSFGKSYPWRTFQTVDINNDGTDEAITGVYYSGDANFPTGSVVLFTQDADTLVPHLIASFNGMSPDHIASLEVGDIDGDGNADIVMGFKYSDMVVDLEYNGTGDITDPASYTLDTLDFGSTGLVGKGQVDVLALADMDGDGADEVFYAGVPRSIDENVEDMIYGKYGTWTVDGTFWDIAVANNKIYGFRYAGKIFTFFYDQGDSTWKYGPIQHMDYGAVFKSAGSFDIDGDGHQEIMFSDYKGSGDVYVMKEENGAMQIHAVANLSGLGAGRLTGGAVGDVDKDGFVDFFTGSRADSDPMNAIWRVEYRGGDITDPNNWNPEIIDHDINTVDGTPHGGQIDEIRIANMDADSLCEVVYSGIPRGGNPIPIVIVDIQQVTAEPIADVKVDANGDFVPDRLGEEVTVQGVVTSPSYSPSSLLVTIQDETAAIMIYQSGNDSIRYEIGTILQVTGEVSQYKGLTELKVTDPAKINALGLGTVPAPIEVDLATLNEKGEEYEGMFIKINGVGKEGDTAWPDSGHSAKIYLTDGWQSFPMYLDRDTHLMDNNPEPTWPVNVMGIVGQWTSSSTPDNGYQIWPRFYSDFEQNVDVAPNPHFYFTTFFHDSVEGKTVYVTDPAHDYTLQWHSAVDLNGDQLLYQVVVFDATGKEQDYMSTVPTDTFYAFTGQDLVGWLAGADSGAVMVTVRTTSNKPSEGIVASVDTLHFSIVDKTTGVEERLIPKKFFVDQNYPNPFNPTTVIRFGLPKDMTVDLRVYNILGQQVATLISGQHMKAGVYEKYFNASNLASGTYIYRLQAGNKAVTKKMMLVK